MRNSPLKGMASLLAVAATAVVLTGCCVTVQIGGRHAPFYGPEYRHHEFARIHNGRECPPFERDRFCPRLRDGRECPKWRDGRERPMMRERPGCCPMARDGKVAPARAGAACRCAPARPGDGCKCAAGGAKCAPDCQMYRKQPGPMNRDGKPAPPPAPPAPPAK